MHVIIRTPSSCPPSPLPSSPSPPPPPPPPAPGPPTLPLPRGTEKDPEVLGLLLDMRRGKEGEAPTPGLDGGGGAEVGPDAKKGCPACGVLQRLAVGGWQFAAEHWLLRSAQLRTRKRMEPGLGLGLAAGV